MPGGFSQKTRVTGYPSTRLVYRSIPPGQHSSHIHSTCQGLTVARGPKTRLAVDKRNGNRRRPKNITGTKKGISTDCQPIEESDNVGRNVKSMRHKRKTRAVLNKTCPIFHFRGRKANSSGRPTVESSVSVVYPPHVRSA